MEITGAPAAWKTMRKPLQPRNVLGNLTPARKRTEKRQQQQRFSDKENCPFLEAAAVEVAIEPVGASLAEELESVRQRVERLRRERERTERILGEKERVLEERFREMEAKEEKVRKMKLELDQVLEWKKLRASMAVGCLKTLREQVLEKKMNKIDSTNEEQMSVPSSSCR